MVINICFLCFQLFHTDDFELQYLQKGHCPFCRSTLDDWMTTFFIASNRQRKLNGCEMDAIIPLSLFSNFFLSWRGKNPDFFFLLQRKNLYQFYKLLLYAAPEWLYLQLRHIAVSLTVQICRVSTNEPSIFLLQTWPYSVMFKTYPTPFMVWFFFIRDFYCVTSLYIYFVIHCTKQFS